MLRANASIKKGHDRASRWWEWPIMRRSVLYWVGKEVPYINPALGLTQYAELTPSSRRAHAELTPSSRRAHAECTPSSHRAHAAPLHAPPTSPASPRPASTVRPCSLAQRTHLRHRQSPRLVDRRRCAAPLPPLGQPTTCRPQPPPSTAASRRLEPRVRRRGVRDRGGDGGGSGSAGPRHVGWRYDGRSGRK